MKKCLACCEECQRNPALKLRPSDIEKKPSQGMGEDYFIKLSPGNIARIKLSKKNAKKYHIEWVYVPPDFRGLGLGDLLMKRVLRDANRLGINLSLVARACGTMHQDKLERWYENFGFAPGRLVKLGKDVGRYMTRVA